MYRFDLTFSFAALVLIGVSVVCLCKIAEYRSQTKFATERYEEIRDSFAKAERDADRKIMETEAEWKAKIRKTERDAETAEKKKELEHRLEIKKTRAELADEIARRDEQIRILEERIVKLSNDAVMVIARLRARRIAAAPPQSRSESEISHTGYAGNVVDRSCDGCGGRGRIFRKETCAACRGQGCFVRTITKVRDVYGESRYTTVKNNCNACGGKGWVKKSVECMKCNGGGRVPLRK